MRHPFRSSRRKQVFSLVVVLSFLSVFTGSRSVFASSLWTEQTETDNGLWWKVIKSSGSGGYLVAAAVNMGDSSQHVLLSRDAGATWNDVTPDAGLSARWADVAISDDGYTLSAIDGNGGYIWTTFNDGGYWQMEDGVGKPGAGYWSHVAMAENGQDIIVTDSSDRTIYSTTDNANTWTNVAPGSETWSAIAYSPSGFNLAVAPQSGYICSSSNHGSDWFCGEAVDANWQSLSAADNGMTVANAGYSAHVYLGTGYGASWHDTGFDGFNDSTVTISGDGSVMVDAQNYGGLFLAQTDDYEVWTPQNADGDPGYADWGQVGINYDGTKIAAAGYLTHVWTYAGSVAPADTTPPVITITGSSDVSFVQGTPYTDAGATALDDTDGDVTESITTDNNVNIDVPGSYRVIYSVHDAALNEASSTRTVTVTRAASGGHGHRPSSSGGSSVSGGSSSASQTTPVAASGTHYQFPRNLKSGMVGDDVQKLQNFLNTHGFPLAATGPGSLGNETTRFGSLTKQALMKFQEAHPNEILIPQQLPSGTGNFFGFSRTYVNSVLAAGQ